jgi:hypothetical protein
MYSISQLNSPLVPASFSPVNSTPMYKINLKSDSTQHTTCILFWYLQSLLRKSHSKQHPFLPERENLYGIPPYCMEYVIYRTATLCTG